MEKVKCYLCKKYKFRKNFYKANTKRGITGRCKECERTYYQDNIERKREITRKYTAKSCVKKRRAKYSAEWGKRNRDKLKKNVLKFPEKFKARKLFRNAVNRGDIIRQPCGVCGKKKSDGHHPDYSKPYEVMWLCRKHHLKLHRKS